LRWQQAASAISPRLIAPSPIGWPVLAPVESALLREIVHGWKLTAAAITGKCDAVP
jgi:hypothetical protein